VWASSDAVFASLVDEHPRLWLVEYRAGLFLASQGRPAEALPWLESALRKTGVNDAGVALDYVKVMRTLGHYDATEPVLRHLIDVHPKTVPPYFEMANLRIAQGRYADALALLDTAARVPRWGAESMPQIRARRAVALDGLARQTRTP
jgi:Tfp pilus assembly protein PilF